MSGIVGTAVGALLAPPLICLIASPPASADTPDVTGPGDDITTLGPYTVDGYTDTLSINDTTFASDNYLTDTVGTTTYDLDGFYGPGTDNYGVILTDPGLFQIGYDDIGGTPSVIADFTPADFLSADFGLTEIAGGGAVGADALAGLFGL
jgi:hypothetical protein